LAGGLGRRSPPKADPGTLATESGPYKSETKFNPRIDLKVGHYKGNPKKENIGSGDGTIVGIRRLYIERGCTAGQFVSGTFGEDEREINGGDCVSSNRDKQASG